MTGFYQDAQSIFETAQGASESADFALMIRPDGGLHMLMNSPVSLEGAAAYTGASAGYHVSRSADGVRVRGYSGEKSCMFESVSGQARASQLLRDRPLYALVGPASVLRTPAALPPAAHAA